MLYAMKIVYIYQRKNICIVNDVRYETDMQNNQAFYALEITAGKVIKHCTQCFLYNVFRL